MQKKLFTLLLAIVISIGLTQAEVYSGTCGADGDGSNLAWSLNTEDSTLIISGNGKMYDYSYYSQNYAKLSPWYYHNSFIKYITINNGVTSIGTYAFYQCSRLSSITIHSDLNTINSNAFSNCVSLQYVYIDDLQSWLSINIGSDVASPLTYGAHLFLNNEEIIDLIIPEGMISTSNLRYHKYIKSITLPESLKSLSPLEGCTSLTTIYWNAVEMNDYTYDSSTPFYYNYYGHSGYDLTKQINLIVIGPNVKYIPAYVFNYWSSINISFPYGNTPAIGTISYNDSFIYIGVPCGLEKYYKDSIDSYFGWRHTHEYYVLDGNNPFNIIANSDNPQVGKAVIIDSLNCEGKATLKAISLDSLYHFSHWNDGDKNDVKVVENIYSDTSFTAYFIRNKCGEQMYWGIYGDTLKIIGQGDMYDYSMSNPAPWSNIHYSNILMEEGISKIGDYAFYNKALNSINLPKTISTIGDYAFYGHFATSIIAPNNLKNIGAYALYGSSSLHAIYLNKSTISFGIHSVKADTIYYDGTLAEWCNLDFPSIWNNPCASTLEYNHTYTLLVGGASGSYYTDNNFKSSTVLYIEGEKVDSLIIGNDIERIKPFSFAGCASIKSVIYNNNNLTDIAETAFWGCVNLETLEMRSADNKFWGNQNLRNIIWNVSESLNFNYKNTPFYHNNTTYINEITNQSTKYMSIAASIKGLYFGESVTSIPNYLCYGMNNVDTIVIPCNVEKIPQRAFDNCSAKLVYHNVIPGAYVDHDEEGNYRSGRIYLSAYDGNGGHAAYDYAIINDDSTTHYSMGNYINSLTKGTYKISFFSNSDCAPKDTWLTINRYAMKYGDCYYQLDDNTMTALVTYRGENYDSYDEYSGNITIPKTITFDENEYQVIGINSYAFSGCNNITSITMESETPISMYSSGLSNHCVIYVPFGSLNTYKSASEWNNYTIHVINPSHATATTGATSATITLGNTNEVQHIASCGMEGGEEEFAGNVIEYIGLEPNSEYTNIPLFIKTKEGDKDNITVSFTTTALTLTTKPSKTVSATTAILLAETNMSDAEINCGFEYKRNDAPADMDGTKVFCPVASGQMAGRLKNLKDDVYYKYRAFYQSSAGNMYYGDWQYIFTGDVAVEFDPILYTYSATVVRENEATISGYALAGSEDFTEQGFEYWAESRVNGQSDQVPSTNGAPRRMPAALNEHFFVQASGISLRVTLTNLDAGTVYKYRVYGKVGDQYYYGSEQTFTTTGTYTPPTYTITFANWDGATLQSSQVTEGEMPEYTGATPVRPEDEQNTYSFNGWSPAIVAATADATYTATYTATPKSQAIEEVPSDQVQCTKILHNGQIFILRGDKIYTLQGQVVK